ncbi:hypothetical protein [Nocardioides sp.]|uniref:hypothetical protein n=1 Tax=Nocardioides sp. TaxID=35761 RepID=UPI0035139B24
MRPRPAAGSLVPTVLLTLVLPLTVTLAAVLVLLAPPAEAQGGSVRYVRGDAIARLDNVALKVVNGGRAVTWTTTVRDLGRRGLFEFVYYAGRDEKDSSTVLNLKVRRTGAGLATKIVIFQDGDGAQYPCDGVSARWDRRRSTVSATMPQRCFLGDPPDGGRFAVFSRDKVRGEFVGDNVAPASLSLRRG